MRTIYRISGKWIVSISLVIALATSAGSLENVCNWSQSHGNAAHTAHCDVNMTPPFGIVWEKTLESGGISGSPVVSGDYLVILSPRGTVWHEYSLLCFRMERTELKFVWRQSLLSAELGTTPAIIGSRVICPSVNGLHCFDLETGRTLWECEFESTPETPVIIQNDLAAVTTKPVFQTRYGYLSLVDISIGEILWTVKNLEGTPCHFSNMTTAGDGRLFVCYSATDEEGIAAFNLEGELLWKKPGEMFHVFVEDSACVTLFTEGILFAVGVPTTLFALDGESGDILWSYEGKSLVDALSSDGAHIYVYSRADEAALCLDIHTGKEIWKSLPLFPGDRELLMFFDKSLISSKNCVFICRHITEDSGTANIFALDSITGGLIWTSEELEDLSGPLILWNDMLIAKTPTTLLAFGEVRGSTSAPPETAPPETAPPETAPPETAPTTSTESPPTQPPLSAIPPEPSTPIPLVIVLILASIVVGVTRMRKRRS